MGESLTDGLRDQSVSKPGQGLRPDWGASRWTRFQTWSGWGWCRASSTGSQSWTSPRWPSAPGSCSSPSPPPSIWSRTIMVMHTFRWIYNSSISSCTLLVMNILFYILSAVNCFPSMFIKIWCLYETHHYILPDAKCFPRMFIERWCILIKTQASFILNYQFSAMCVLQIWLIQM